MAHGPLFAGAIVLASSESVGRFPFVARRFERRRHLGVAVRVGPSASEWDTSIGTRCCCCCCSVLSATLTSGRGENRSVPPWSVSLALPLALLTRVFARRKMKKMEEKEEESIGTK